ncbi:Integrator complex subunit 9-like [Paramuricea clavata]|uniref:Integrator complex subunit 9-like n=1 Tax=Paramuricea clavata TaxID=317549 RepID=A0A6S7J8K2_PARCT|nr:Integrator complex subunit 9-like [Paramuricea clavata]
MASPCAEDNESANTIRATKGSKTIFQDYLNEKELKFPEKSEELAVILPKFYSEVRKKDGSKYTKNSLCALRFGLNRHFKALLHIDIIKDKAFDRANKAYEAECVNLKSIGLDKPGHKPPISDADIKRLYECGLFDTDSPNTLQNKVFFEIMLYFCRRGRQNLRQLKKDDFVIKINPQGQKYVVKTGDTTKLDDGEEGGMMIAGGGPLCPVYSFEKYLSHLNPVNKFLFQRPRENCPSDGIVWYDNNVVGENTLGKKMRVLSVQANLSVEYTNHSIRATTITILNRYGYLAKHIMSVSGHKNESSITKYCNRTGQKTKTKMADCLMNIIEHTKKCPEPVDNKSAANTFPSQVEFSTNLNPRILLAVVSS